MVIINKYSFSIISVWQRSLPVSYWRRYKKKKKYFNENQQIWSRKRDVFVDQINEGNVNSSHSHTNAINVDVFLFVIKINAMQLRRN